jgi:glyoxylase-like metal-dependent hydrolase (beta-lactamase superfamily II)
MLKIGNAELRRVEDMVSALPMSLFTKDDAFLEEQSSWLVPGFMDEAGNCPMVFQSWILVLDDKLVVVDPCAGNDRNSPNYPMFHMLKTPYLERFEATGFKPEEVDYVFCTHLHGDHCGWNTRLRGDRFVPTFPNARYVMVRREFERWDPRRPGHQPVREIEGVFEASVIPVLEAGLVDLVGDEHRLLPSLSIEPSNGHTIAHSTLHLRSDEREAYFIGDAFHHVIQVINPDLDLGGAEDLAATLASRRRLIRQCIDRNALLVPAHFPAPYAGWVREQNGKTVFVPLDAEI